MRATVWVLAETDEGQIVGVYHSIDRARLKADAAQWANDEDEARADMWGLDGPFTADWSAVDEISILAPDGERWCRLRATEMPLL